MFSSCCSAADRTALRLYGSAAERSLTAGAQSCDGGGGQKTPKYDHLTVYSPLPESETLLYCSAFRKDTGITVDCIHLPAGEMTARLEQERDNPQASVLLGGSADNYIQLREAGLLEAYQSPELTECARSLSG